MTTLFDALLTTAQLVGMTRSGVNTASGNGTTIIDSTLGDTTDAYNGGTIFLTSVLDVPTFVPASRRIVAYWQTSGTVTFTPTVTVPGNVFTAGSNYFTLTNARREDIVQAVNMALRQIGAVTKISDALVVINNTQTYALPTGVSNVTRVAIANDASDPVEYHRSYSWHEYDGSITIHETIMQNAGNIIRLYYDGQPTQLNADTDVISDLIDRNRLAWTSAYHFFRNRLAIEGNQDQRVNMLMQEAQAKAEQLARTNPVRRQELDAKLARW